MKVLESARKLMADWLDSMVSFPCRSIIRLVRCWELDNGAKNLPKRILGSNRITFQWKRKDSFTHSSTIIVKKSPLSLSLEQFECRIHTSFSCVLPRILAAFWDALGQDMVENGSGDFFCWSLILAAISQPEKITNRNQNKSSREIINQ